MKRHEPGHVCWADLNTEDIEAQTAFYEALFGWTHLDVLVDGALVYRRMQKDGRDVVGMAPFPPGQTGKGLPPAWFTYIATSDPEATMARATELGGDVFMPGMDVADLGSMTGIADPGGAMVGFWHAGELAGAGVFGEPGTLLYSDIATHDLGAVADYYEALLGWEVDRSGAYDPDYWGVSVDDERELGIMRMAAELPPEVPPHWLVYLGSADVAADTARVVQLGGSVDMGPVEIPVADFSIVSDPLGGTFALMRMKERPPA